MVSLQLFVERLGLTVRGSAKPHNHRVRWVHISELPDPSPYLRGGEFLLLAGTSYRPEESVDYVERLVRAGVTAVGFGVTPVFDTVPAELVAACDRQDLVLLEVPPEVPFSAVVEMHHMELTRAETRDLRRLADGQSVLIRAASGPAPVQTVVDRLAELLEAGVVVVDHHRGRRWTAGTMSHDREVATALRRVCTSRTPMSAAVASAGGHAEVQRLIGPAPAGYGMAVVRPRPFSIADRGLTGVAASALSLLFTDAEADASQDVLGAAVVSGLLRLPTLSRDLAVVVDRSDDVLLRVVRGRAKVGREGPDERFAALLGTPLVQRSDDGFVALIPADRPVDEVCDIIDEAGLIAGISRPHSAPDIEGAWADAGVALNGALLSGASAVAGARPAGVLGLVDGGRADRYTDDVLAVLDGRPGGAPGPLLTTLMSWLTHHGNWDRTAADLGVHRNTVRNRINHAARLLDRDLNDPDVRMELWFALRWRSHSGARH
ncbi:PucR family transcriptional regulator [Phytoactinopolyspora limicola]|uniref:PucR family transcriptional regulator n=1 Tax=Phytoactinopolyspora limicola TaxID=2715536 RepID=UPI001A9C65FA|nr:PucR family transcriptional regulator [Phytoactinopolyspora limicola]